MTRHSPLLHAALVAVLAVLSTGVLLSARPVQAKGKRYALLVGVTFATTMVFTA